MQGNMLIYYIVIGLLILLLLLSTVQAIQVSKIKSGEVDIQVSGVPAGAASRGVPSSPPQTQMVGGC